MLKNRKILIAIILSLGLTILLLGFKILNFYHRSSHQEMVDLLKELNKKSYSGANPFNPEAKKVRIDSMLKIPFEKKYFPAEIKGFTGAQGRAGRRIRKNIR
jgi:hypothetical protein